MLRAGENKEFLAAKMHVSIFRAKVSENLWYFCLANDGTRQIGITEFFSIGLKSLTFLTSIKRLDV